jgi:hypothetical protein
MIEKAKVAVNYSNPINAMIERLATEPPIPFIWSGIKKGSFGFVFGPAKSGKTIFCEILAISLASGLAEFMNTPLLQEEVIPKVLFISLEEYWQPRTERNKAQVKQLAFKYNVTELSNYLVINEEFPRFFSGNDDWKKLESLITSTKADLVFIDSLTRLYSGDIETSNTGQQITQRLRELANRLSITLIVIHHTRKMSGSPITLDSLAGSRVLGQEADFLIGINKGLNGDRYYKEVSFRYKAEDDEKVTLFKIDDNLWVVPTNKVSEASLLCMSDRRRDDSKAIEILQFIEDYADSTTHEITTKILIEYFVDTQHMVRSTLFENLRKLVENGNLIQPSKGVYKFIE